MKSPESIFTEMLEPKLRKILPSLSLAAITAVARILSDYLDNPGV